MRDHQGSRSDRPQTYPTCDELVDVLGEDKLRIVAPGDPVAGIRHVAIHDPGDVQVAASGTLVLAPNIPAPEIPALLDECARGGGVAIVCRGPVEAAAGHQVAVLELATGVPWTQLADDVRRVLTAWSTTSTPVAGARPTDELFSALDAAAVLLDAPLALEDTSLAVLAWSDRQDQADGERLTGILGRRAPGWLVSTLEARGVFAKLAASDEPLFLEPASRTALPRMATAVRIDGELFGYLWATSAEPFGAGRCRDFTQIARAIARILQNGGPGRTGSAALPPRRADLVAAMLRGVDATGLANRLGIAAHKLTIIAARTPRAAETGDSWSDRRKILEPLTLYLSIRHAKAMTTFVDGTTYALLPWPPSTSDHDALAGTRKIAEEFHRRAAADSEIVLAIGGIAGGAAEIVEAREEAELVLRTLLEHAGTPSVATFSDVQVAFVLSELACSLRRTGKPLEGPVDQVDRHDRLHRTELLPTLRAYLDFFGDVRAASERLHIHPNTFRNRLHRITELTGFDVADPDARFVAELQLRLRFPTEAVAP